MGSHHSFSGIHGFGPLLFTAWPKLGRIGTRLEDGRRRRPAHEVTGPSLLTTFTTRSFIRQSGRAGSCITSLKTLSRLEEDHGIQAYHAEHTCTWSIPPSLDGECVRHRHRPVPTYCRSHPPNPPNIKRGAPTPRKPPPYHQIPLHNRCTKRSGPSQLMTAPCSELRTHPWAEAITQRMVDVHD